MRVDDVGQVFRGAFHLESNHGLGDEFGRGRSDDVHAENFPVLAVGDDLHEAFVLTDDAGT